MADLSPLTAVSPVDGRYHTQTQCLSQYFSECALFKYRTRVEVEYLIALAEVPLPQLEGITEEHKAAMRTIVSSFTVEDAGRIKEIERTTNHDVKAVEYFLKERGSTLSPPIEDRWKEFIHFALTSQDINNCAVPLSLKDAVSEQVIPRLSGLIDTLTTRAKEWMPVSMLARTHGQPATPTTLGKEFLVFVDRLQQQKLQLEAVPHCGKFGGATGGFNAHHVAFPHVDWVDFATKFLEHLGLKRSRYTTQIEHYDNIAALFHALCRLNTILIDFARDVWQYISMDYFKQKVKAGEVGSSAMPHKVNPIDFENAEANLGVANAVMQHFASKLPISRLQRDLTDSSVLRNVGVAFAHTVIAYNSIEKGLGKLVLNKDTIDADLEGNWAVCAEGIQTILRREAFEAPYEALKQLTRGHQVNQATFAEFINGLDVSDAIKEELRAVTPQSFTGVTVAL